MTTPIHNNVKFGQRDHRELRVEPQWGRVGTSFRFNAFYFPPGKTVRVIVQGPDQFIIYSSMLETDAEGSIGYVGLSMTTTRDWPLGTYTFSVDGLEETFTLTR